MTVSPRTRSATDRLRTDAAPAQFARFVVVGGLSSAVYAVLFLTLAGWGDQLAVAGPSGAIADLAIIAVVPGAIGLVRFAALR